MGLHVKNIRCYKERENKEENIHEYYQSMYMIMKVKDNYKNIYEGL